MGRMVAKTIRFAGLGVLAVQGAGVSGYGGCTQSAYASVFQAGTGSEAFPVFSDPFAERSREEAHAATAGVRAGDFSNIGAQAGMAVDGDGDGVFDAEDDCPNTIPGVLVEGDGCPAAVPGDFDGDGDADIADFAVWRSCLAGPAVPGDAAFPCGEADFDLDFSVDLKDAGALQGCFSGADRAADPLCVRHSARIVAGCLRIQGTPASTLLALRLQAGAPATLQVDVGDDGTADFSFDRNLFDCILVRAGGGHDTVRIDEVNGTFTTEEWTTIDGGSGNDKLVGGSGAETFLGGPGNDFVEGNRGIDLAVLGSGDDVFQWDPGDGSDTVEGESGNDILAFNGAGAGELFDLSANGERMLLFRDPGSITMDCDDVEQVDLAVFGGADSVAVHSLAETDVVEVNINLAEILGGDTGDGQPDNILVEATDGLDVASVSGSGTLARVRGLSALVGITAAEIANDRLTVNAFAGDDTLQASGLASGVLAFLTLDGGGGHDLLIGSGGIDVLNGGDGNDTVVGGDGDDVVHLGTGNDRFVWNPGDDTDIVDGDEGVDTVVVNGGDEPEDFTVTADGTRVRVDLSSVSSATLSLDIGGTEELVLNANGGNDTLACSGNLTSLIHLKADGGPGNDTLMGSNGADLLLGGDGDDFIDGQQGADNVRMGSGDDVFQWDPGDGSDIVEGQDGTDTLVFNGSGVNELFDLSADGGRLHFTRSVGEIIMDCDGVEEIDLAAVGGADTVVVKSLVGTDVVDVIVDLAGVPGGATGDGQPDNLIVAGTEFPDVIGVTVDSGAVVVAGLSAAVRIEGAEARADLLVVNGLGGVDNIESAPEVGDVIILQIVNE